MKKNILTLLLAAMLLATTVSCSGKTDSDTSKDTANTTDTTGGDTMADTETTTDTDEDDFVANLPSADYEGKSFRVDSANTLVGIDSATTINIAEELTGEVVNDALYNRDRYLEQQYNVVVKNTINETRDASVYEKGVLAGDAGFDVAFGDVASYGSYIVIKGCCYPMNFVENVHLDREY